MYFFLPISLNFLIQSMTFYRNFNDLQLFFTWYRSILTKLSTFPRNFWWIFRIFFFKFLTCLDNLFHISGQFCPFLSSNYSQYSKVFYVIFHHLDQFSTIYQQFFVIFDWFSVLLFFHILGQFLLILRQFLLMFDHFLHF